MRGRGAQDHVQYHEPTIRIFADQWPAMDFSDYLSATTPGYHVVLATFAQLNDSRIFLRLVGSLFAVGLLGTMAWACSVRFRPMQALACALPLATSMYIFDAGIYLLPDAAAWWGVLGIILLCLRRKLSIWTYLAGSIILFSLVFTRQIHIWAAAPLWVAAWIGTEHAGNQTIASQFNHVPRRIVRTLAMVAMTLPAFALLFYFVNLWDGRLIPPSFSGWYSGRKSPATPAFFLTLLGLGSVFYLPYLFVPIFSALCKKPAQVLSFAGIAIAIGLLLAIIPETTESFEDGRFSGIWRAVRVAPIIADHTSVTIMLGSAWGALMLLAWASSLPFRSRWIVLSAMSGFVAAQITSPQLWQRYQEPFILMLLAFMACDVGRWRYQDEESGTTPEEKAFIRFGETVGPFILAFLLALITVNKLTHSPQITHEVQGLTTHDPRTTIQQHEMPNEQSTNPDTLPTKKPGNTP